MRKLEGKARPDEVLTPRQRQVFEFLTKRIRRGMPPSIREIGEALNISSLRGVTDHLEALEAKGWIRRAPHARGILLLREASGAQPGTRGDQPSPAPSDRFESEADLRLPIIGRVPAGQPVTAEEEVEGYLDPPAQEWGENAFALRVKGDSMIEAGILDGDLVVVRPQPEARNGDIVVARVDDEATVKRFFRERTRIRLQPENQKMEPIYLSPEQAEITIVGKVIGVVRHL
jgi:repressor LexA